MKRGVCRLADEGIIKGQPHRAGLQFVRLIRNFDREFDCVTFTQEAWRIGLDHEVFGGDGMAFQVATADGAVVREAQETPLGQRFRHREGEADDAVGIGGQLWVKERSLVEVFAGGDLA